MKSVLVLLTILLSFTGSACSPSEKANEIPEPPGHHGSGNETGENQEGNMKIRLKIGSHTYTATLEDNPTATAFKKMLPMSVDMADVNRNEKYIQLGTNLPHSASNPGTIRTGDLMLWGANGLVLFYKTFSTSYSYTRMGTIDNPDSLESVLGTGNVTIRFELSEDGRAE